MSDAKLFTVAGTSIHKGVQTFRFANSMSRVAVLRANGHTDVNLLPLPYAMNKADAVSYMTKADAVSLITTGAPVFDAVAASSVDATVKVTKAVKRVAEPKVSDEYNGSVDAAKYVDMWFSRAASRVAAKKIKEMA